MVSSKLKFIVLAATVFLHTSVIAEIDWTGAPGLSESDKADIAKLAQNLSLHNPSSALERWRRPSDDRLVLVKSEVFSRGLRLAWREFYTRNSIQGSCASPCTERVGDWSIDGEVSAQERWRFSDGDWFVDVQLDTGISYAEAESIVMAVHRNALVNTPESNAPKRSFDASEISRIQTIDPINREFEFTIDQGITTWQLRVRLNGDEVQIYEGGGVSRA
ncbi:MAG: hypothetical protein V4628_15715 [Pseudomonadota bacterium]